MSYPIIDSKTQKHTFSAIFKKETVVTTLDLVELSAGKFGVMYNSKYSGIKSGHVSGGPVAVSGNGSHVVNPNPKVEVIVSNYSDSGSHISMHIKITVAIPVLGTKTIFDATLGGEYGVGGWDAIVSHLESIAKSAKETAEV